MAMKKLNAVGDDLHDNSAADSNHNDEEVELSIELSFGLWLKKMDLNLNGWWESKTIIQLSNSFF